MTIDELVKKYRTISAFLNERWPLADQNQRTFARMMKVTEELGELSDEILTSMNLQRDSKIQKFTQENVEDEFADVLGSLILLAIELDIDVAEAIKRKIDYTIDRFQIPSES
jgi:NTP pyrophosphatase (non-canonical NTP hydrolase)